MNSHTKQLLLLISFGVILFAALMNLETVLTYAGLGLHIISPIVLGLIIAFILNVPMAAIERLLSRIAPKIKHPSKYAAIRVLSLILTLTAIGLLAALAVNLAIPALSESASSISPLIEEKFPELKAFFESTELNFSLTTLTDIIRTLDLSMISSNAENIISSAMTTASSAVSGVINVVFGIVIAIYVLLSKSTIGGQINKLLYANLKKERADRIYYICRLVRQTYSKFLSGQCVEAAILGTLIFIAFSICRLPYAGLIGFLTGIFSLIPYIGGCISCLIGAFLIVLAAPERILIAVIVYVIIQFVENQFIYPHVVGGTVGLAPIWTLLAALIGGKLFGLTGIIFFIPLAAVIFVLLKENTYRKLIKKNLLPENGELIK